MISVQADNPPDGGGDADPDDLHDGFGGHAPHVIDENIAEIEDVGGNIADI